MRRTINGVEFIIHSPSTYQLVLQGGGEISMAVLAYDGQYWTLMVMFKRGHTVTRDFTSRDAGITLLASRRSIPHAS